MARLGGQRALAAEHWRALSILNCWPWMWIDLGDTVEHARWTGASLQIQDARGTVTAILVTDNRLGVMPGQA